MAVSPLASALIGGQTASPLMGDPALMAAMPDIQLGQAMEQQGISTAPAYPTQALARLAQTLAGQTMVKGGLSDLANAYGNSADSMAKIFPAGTPIGDALRSPNPLVRMTALQQAPKAMLLQSEGYSLGDGQQRFTGSVPIAENTNPQSPEGKRVRDAVIAARSGNPQGAQAIERGITKETSTNEGVQFPPTNVQPTPQQMADARQRLAQGMGAVQQSGLTNTQPNGVAAEGEAIRNQAPAGSQSMPQQIASAKQVQQGAEGAMKDFVEKDTPAFNSAQSLATRLEIIDHNINALGPSWMGAGADTKAEVAKAWNSTLDSAGVKGMHIDPTKVATWEDFNKETTRAGMELIKSNFGGSREAASIIQMGRTAVPSVQNTYLGAKYVSATIKAANQMQMDLYAYKKQLADAGRLTPGAEADFYKTHPPQSYALGAITSQIPQPAVAHLRSNPNLAPQFDQQFGAGTAEFLLGQHG